MSNALEAELRSQLVAAMKAKDSPTLNLIRMINTRITERRTAKDFTGEVDDALILDVIGTYKKSMEKASADFTAAGDRGKEGLAELQFEIAWCAKWLPEQISDDELRTAVAAAVAALPAKDPKMAGRIVGAIKKQFGDLADAARIKALADELLA